jgi:prevent-host-death family protein
MKTVGSYEAKTHLSKFLEEVENGEELVITRHGKAVARLIPFTQRVDDARLNSAVATMKEFRKGRHLNGLSIKELIEEGRE